MMKKLYSAVAILFIAMVNSQHVRVGTETFSPSEVFKVVSNNRGVLLPNVNITDLNISLPILNPANSLLVYNNNINIGKGFINNPKESLMVYNTNNNLLGKKGYYFWNGTRWDYFVSDTNVDNLKNHTRYYSAISQNKYTFYKSNNEFYGDTNHTIGENITANPSWTVISNLTKNITIDRANNQLLITITGMVHANNANVSGRAVTSFGFFIDDKLVDIKPISIDFDQSCTYRGFTIYATASNLAVGSHVFKFAIRNRSTSSTENGLSITFGGKNPSASCTNISDDEAKLSGTIFVNQPYQF